MQIPSLENVQVDNLPDECREPWDLMIRQWSQKLERNLLRTKYYDGRNELKNLSIAVPDSMAGISEVVGWPQKSVDALADRIVFDSFRQRLRRGIAAGHPQRAHSLMLVPERAQRGTRGWSALEGVRVVP